MRFAPFIFFVCCLCAPDLNAGSADRRCVLGQLTALQKAGVVEQSLQSGRYWFDPQITSYLESHPEEVVNLSRRWYGSEMFPAMVYPRYVEVLGKPRAHLMLDPRILCRTDSFLTWSRDYLLAHPNASVEELRSGFAATLGKSKVFRGMRLESELEAFLLKEQGIKSAGLRFQDEAFIREKMLLEFGSSAATATGHDHAVGFGMEIYNRQLNRGLEKSILVSVSDWMELAASVGYHHAQPVKMAPQGRLYLFEIDLPEFELIRQAGPLLRGPGFAKGKGFYQVGEMRIEFDSFKVEAFIPYQVRPEWIRAIHPYQDPPPKWEFRK